MISDVPCGASSGGTGREGGREGGTGKGRNIKDGREGQQKEGRAGNGSTQTKGKGEQYRKLTRMYRTQAYIYVLQDIRTSIQ